MATTSYWYGYWVSADELGLLPGYEHHWSMWGFTGDEAITVTPVPLNSDRGEQILQVKDVRSEADPAGGRRLLFSVRNAGAVEVLGYGLAYSFVSA